VAVAVILGASIVPQVSHALPIQVTDKVVVEQWLRPKPHPIPARAGWYGPEFKPKPQFNLTYEKYGPQATVARVHDDLWSSMFPDWRLLAAFAICAVLIHAVADRAIRRRAQATSAARVRNKQGPGDYDAGRKAA
jgi:hypothetical protein